MSILKRFNEFNVQIAHQSDMDNISVPTRDSPYIPFHKFAMLPSVRRRDYSRCVLSECYNQNIMSECISLTTRRVHTGRDDVLHHNCVVDAEA